MGTRIDWMQPVAYDDRAKALFLSAARSRLRALAEELGSRRIV